MRDCDDTGGQYNCQLAVKCSSELQVTDEKQNIHDAYLIASQRLKIKIPRMVCSYRERIQTPRPIILLNKQANCERYLCLLHNPFLCTEAEIIKGKVLRHIQT